MSAEAGPLAPSLIDAVNGIAGVDDVAVGIDADAALLLVAVADNHDVHRPVV